jgi:glycosyltransferase involved in cell wall biosynthesis
MRALLTECRELGLTVHFAGIALSEEEHEATIPFVDKWVADFSVLPSSLSRRLSDAVRRRLRCVSCGQRKDSDSVDRWMAPHWVADAKRLQRSAAYPRVLVPYVFHSAFLEAFPSGCRRILDTHDKFAGRRERLASAGIADYWFTTSEAEERLAINRADVVLAIQQAEASYFATLAGPRVAVREVGHFSTGVSPGLRSTRACANRIGILASDNPLNIDAVHFFLTEVWPLVHKKHPNFVLSIAGRICSHIRGRAAGVELVGPVDEVARFYGTCLCTVNAMRVGTGLKIKTLESLAHGCPVVATPTGAEGLESCVGKGLVICDEPSIIASAVSCWIANPIEAAVAGQQALSAAVELNSRWRRGLADALGVN